MDKLKILVIGGGGREHALVWKLTQSSKAGKVFCAPGNAGIARIAVCVSLRVDDLCGIVDFCKKEKIDLVVVGPELPLTLGLVDVLEKAGIKAFGPNKLAAEIEGSKAFAKDIMARYGIPTARYGVFSDMQKAKSFAREIPGPWVVKADGLAAGKGVLICSTLEETDLAIEKILVKRFFGTAGEKVIIEEFLQGEELSLMAFCDGYTAVPMVTVQDHKRALSGDNGVNTGGMGAYSPIPIGTPEMCKAIEEKVLKPALKAMASEGRIFKGVLYAGMMITAQGPRVLEFNARFGDPETQVVLPRLETDLLDIIISAVEGKLDSMSIEWKKESCAGVVMVSGGYPGDYEKGFVISGLEKVPEEVIVFHSGTSFHGDKIVTNGGRVLAVTALADNLQQAVDLAYGGIKAIGFHGAYYRNDIAYRALKR